MRNIYSGKGLLVLALLFCFQIVTGNASEQLARQLSFVENKGQLVDGEGAPVPHVLFKAETAGLNFWITNTGITYQFVTMDKVPVLNDDGTQKLTSSGKPKTDKYHRWKRVDLILKGASINKNNLVTENDVTQGEISYYFTHCPDGIFKVKSYQKITAKDVYPGIDWVIYTSATGTVKYDFVVHPGANPDDIELVYEGNGDISINENHITFTNELGEITEGDLLCYQGDKENHISSIYKAQINPELTYLGVKDKLIRRLKNVEVGEVSTFSYEIKIEVGAYDTSIDLIIDPELAWSTLYGGNALDGVMCTDVDSSGNVYTGGYLSSTNFPTLDPGGGAFYQGTNLSGFAAFILKFNNDGILLWGTYYGGTTGADGITSIDVDVFGNLWAIGGTNAPIFPTQTYGSAYFQGTIVGTGDDGFILKFSSTGARLWATFYGGDAMETFNSICTDSIGNAWVVGITESTNFPVLSLSGAYNQLTSAGGVTEGFILKFNNAGTRLWATHYGGSLDDKLITIDADVNGNVWIGGTTSSADFPVQDAGGYYQSTYAGNRDGVLLKFDNLGAREWSTYYGGSTIEEFLCIKTDSKGDAWVSGRTNSTDFPVQTRLGAYNQSANAGDRDAFLLKLSSTTSRIWASYYGGSNKEHILFGGSSSDELAIDDCDNVYFSFWTPSTDITTLKPSCGTHYYDGSFNGSGGGLGFPFFADGTDCFISKFSSSCTMLWATYLGGTMNDFRGSVAVDKNNNLFVSGEFGLYPTGVAPPSLPFVDPGGGAYFDTIPTGQDESYIAKFTPSITSQSIVVTTNNSSSCVPCNGWAAVTASCGIGPHTFDWSTGEQTIDYVLATDTIKVLCAGNYNVTVTSSCGEVDTAYFSITGPFCSSCPGNLVNNPGFELNTGFPTNLDQLSLVTGWTNTGGAGTPDYLH
ncbi:MAG TPA: hypothetical protein EYN69_07090, partial [Flavobacteriales bacterium]|nr:hypothetical protein [Flavobacteriales bacterium]